MCILVCLWNFYNLVLGILCSVKVCLLSGFRCVKVCVLFGFCRWWLKNSWVEVSIMLLYILCWCCI